MALIELKQIEFNYSDKELYKAVDMKINDGEHCVLVGVNGSGKTTLLNIITRKISPDAGEVYWTPHVTYSYLDQNLKVDQDLITIDYLNQVYAELFLKEKQMEELYEKSASESENFGKYIDKAQTLQDELTIAGFYSLKEDIAKLVAGLGIPEDRLQMPLSKLSSGQREKAYLVRMLRGKRGRRSVG